MMGRGPASLGAVAIVLALSLSLSVPAASAEPLPGDAPVAVLSASGGAGGTAAGTVFKVSSYAELIDGTHGAAVSTDSSGRTVVTLADEVTILVTGRLRITDAVTIHGGTLLRSPALTDTQMISVTTSGDLVLDDVIIDGGAIWEGGVISDATNSGVSASYPAILDAGKLVLRGGSVIRNCANATSSIAQPQLGGAIVVYAGAELTVSGSGIEDCWCRSSAGAIYSYADCVELADAAITGCVGDGNAAILLRGAAATVAVSGDMAVTGASGGIRLRDDQMVEVTGQLGDGADIGLLVAAGDATRVRDLDVYAPTGMDPTSTAPFSSDDAGVRLVFDGAGGLKAASASSTPVCWSNGDSAGYGDLAAAFAAANSAASGITRIRVLDSCTVAGEAGHVPAGLTGQAQLDVPAGLTLTADRPLRVLAGAQLTVSGGGTILRDATLTDQAMLLVAGSLTARDILIDGGAVWDADGANRGVAATRPIIQCAGDLTLLLGAVVRNGQNVLPADSGSSWNHLGGGVCVYGDGSSLRIDGGLIEGCSCLGYGGGILTYGGCAVDLPAAHVTGNSALAGGGALIADCPRLTIGEAQMTGNSAEKGGAFYLIDCQGTIDGAQMCDNAASSSGGGVYLQGGATDVTMVSGGMRGNTAGANGGAVAIGIGASFRLAGGEVSGNTAACEGGGIRVAGGTLHLTGGSVTGNVAGSAAGGVSIRPDVYPYRSMLTVSGAASVQGNSLTEGTISNVHLREGQTVTVEGTLSPGASIGVTTVVLPLPGAPVDVTGDNGAVDCSARFTDDRGAFTVSSGGADGARVVQLGAPEVPTSPVDASTLPGTGDGAGWMGLLGAGASMVLAMGVGAVVVGGVRSRHRSRRGR